MRLFDSWATTDSDGKQHTLVMYAEDTTNLIIHGAYRVDGKFITCFNNGFDAYDFFCELDPSEDFSVIGGQRIVEIPR